MRLFSVVSDRGTDGTDSFLMPNVLRRINLCGLFRCLRCLQMFTDLAISCTFIRASVNTKSWTFVMLSYMVAVFEPVGASQRKPRATILKPVVAILAGRRRKRRKSIYSIQASFHFSARFLSKKQLPNHLPILFFSSFRKSADATLRKRTFCRSGATGWRG